MGRYRKGIVKEKKLDWKQIGQFVAMLVRLFSTIAQTFKIHAVGPEIISWLDGGIGKDVLLQKLGEIATEYRALTVPREISVNTPNILHIDRSKPFSPNGFLGDGWTIEEEDGRSLALARIDLTKVQLVSTLRPGENSVGGEERLERLKQVGHIRLDAGVFQTLLDNQERIPSSWKEPIGGNTRFIYFDGTILRNPYGSRCVLCLCWHGGKWSWNYVWLGNGFNANNPSALLAS